MKKLMKGQVYLFLLLSVACTVQPTTEQATSDVYEGIEFTMPRVQEPTFPDFSVSVKDYGAKGDGQTINTQAFADAIAAVSEKGGGRVIIPRGVWITGPIILKSNINIHAAKGALIIFSPNKDLYPLTETSFEGLNTVRCMSPIYGKDLENIAFTGEGVFDGSGDAWRQVKRSKLTDSQWKSFVNSGGVLDDRGKSWFPSESFKKGAAMSSMNVPEGFNKIEDYEEIKDFLRPVMVSLISCNKVLLDGPVFQNSPAWNIHPLMCENLTVRNIDVRNPWYSQNGDGIDIESCLNTVVYDCTFDVGDDAICIKSGKDQDGRDRGIPTENLIVKNCIVYHGHGGVTVGSEMSGGVKNMHVSGCTFMGTDVGLRFKSNRGRGGVVDGVYISNINMTNIPATAISFNLYYGGLSVSEMMARKGDAKEAIVRSFAVTEETPQFKNITIKNVVCKGARQGIFLQGLPEMNLENVLLENIEIECERGLQCIDADGIVINDLRLYTSEFPAMTFMNAKNISLTNLSLPSVKRPLILIDGEKTTSFKMSVQSDVDTDQFVMLGSTVAKNAVEFTPEESDISAK